MPEVQELNTEVKQLFSTTRDNPRVIRLAIRMRDMIDEAPLRETVGKAVRRYPYLCVRLEARGGRLVLARNRRDVPVFHSPDPHPLAGAEAGRHLIAFSWWDNWIYLDVFHGLSDGTGAYALARTLLWYYCELFLPGWPRSGRWPGGSWRWAPMTSAPPSAPRSGPRQGARRPPP